MTQIYRYIFLAIVFLAAAIVTWLLVRYTLAPRITTSRLEGNEPLGTASGWIPKIAALVGPAAKLTTPKEDWLQSHIRVRMMNAGMRSEYAPLIFYGMKAVLAVALPVITFLFAIAYGVAPSDTALLVALTAAIGYYAPNVYLIMHIRKRKREIFNAFPEALDLMVVCVEAGLGIDAAISKVGEEMGRSCPALGEELHLSNLELRAGRSREAALRNLALRSGVEDIDTLVAMLIQSEKFGTSIADALRVHADSMRTKRMLRAEEMAQKLPVKLIFPVVFLIFPSLFIVLLGPSVLTLAKLLGPMLQS